MNLFLYDRARIVHESMSLSAARLRYISILRSMLWLVLVIGIPVLYYWSIFVAFTGVVDTFGNCVFFAILPQVVISFAVADAFLSLGMLLIFLVPLWHHTSHLKNSFDTAPTQIRTLHRVIQRNIICSSIALTSAFVIICFRMDSSLRTSFRDKLSSSLGNLCNILRYLYWHNSDAFHDFCVDSNLSTKVPKD
jgi:hypothetical protein